jgi:GNAT superfamily N-acetyltransferase
MTGIRNQESGIRRQESGIRWRAGDLLSQLLERDERDTVLGDLVEARASGMRALIEIAGLVTRRQAELWLEWRPWFALITIAVPLGFLLSVASRGFADGVAHDARLYARTAEWAYFAVPGWRRDVIAAALVSAGRLFALAGWSWTTGYVLARISRRAWWAVTLLFGTIVVTATLPSTTTGSAGYPAAHFLPVGLFFTGVVRVALVLWPAWLGLTRGRVHGVPRVSAAVITVVVPALTIVMARSLEWSLIYGWGLVLPQPGLDGVHGTADDLRPLWWISFVMICRPFS